ncbi:hypothetical protein [Dyella choica]|uniref:Uncharacterized protein n=1 Tax=Dyella choica TaxID=1927959 RepID=A0A432M338_9GAMM|nr:hypothetical protein [Dyella choica]RUL72990.1 hypothetical protein EKH80_16680 [Dyella choica]
MKDRTVNKNIVKWIFLALAWAWLPLHAQSYYYVFVPSDDLVDPSTPADRLPEALSNAAHLGFRNGIRANHPERYDDNMAWRFFHWLADDDSQEPPGLFAYYRQPDFQAWEPGQTGVLFRISPNERSFPLASTINNLMGVFYEEPSNRILQFLRGVHDDTSGQRLRVAGVPLPTDTATPVNPLIRGENIHSARVYINGELGVLVNRNDEDGPFHEAPVTNSVGYPFPYPTPPEPRMYNATVTPPGTDHLASLAGCSHHSSSRTSRSAPFDRTAQGHGSCLSETITLDEFNRRHARHRGVMTAVQLLLW